ncbi:cordon-bleu protein-like 1 isoform X2 [Brienomyrus brachyistius]|nr:cordon-bleu protein-like 1 isoform X2 [Brienomyrus brachyistius]XP_048834000.1 cordon-bleu protein-like 1 isoform X2 [Brienomyrus brachyistius]
MDQKENLVNRELKLAVVLPGGAEKTAIINGSEPVMDLLVTLCAQYRLNPSSHTIELISANRNDIKFKPNSLIGSLEAEKILIKPKGAEDRNKKTGPHLPEATVRLIINHKKTQKTILRVSPQAPLESLVPAICEKCEFNPKTTLLLRDVNSEEPLDLTKSLNDYGLRELYARDIKGGVNAYHPASFVHQEETDGPAKGRVLKDKENRGLFGSLFRKSKKKTEQAVPMSASTSPILARKRPESMAIAPSSTNVSMKRRAPAPPVTPALHPPSDLSQQESPVKLGLHPEGRQERGRLMRGFSETSLKSTKRRAPPPPRAVTIDETSLDESVKGAAISEASACASSTGPGVVGEIHHGDHRPREPTGIVEKSAPDTMYIEMQGSTPLEGATVNGPVGPSSDGKEAGIPMNHKESFEKALDVDEAIHPEHKVVGDEKNEQEKVPCGKIPELVGDENKSVTGEPMNLPPLAHESPTPPCTKLQPTSQEVGVQALDPLSTGTLETDHPGSVKAPTSSSPDTPPSLPKTPPSPGFSLDRPQLKRDMSTSTEEGGPDPVLSGAPCEAQTITVTKQPLVHIKDSQPKPKPSIELTRDYTPKVGLTSYTIVPSKSVDKLRFFEVELTLEAPAPDVPPEASKSSSEHVVPSSKTSQPQNLGDKAELYSLSLRDNLQLHNGTHNNTASSPTSTPERDEPFPGPPLPHVEGTADAPQLGKKNKVPPPVRPKPASSRWSLPKRTPGYYVTSAADKDVIGSSHCSADEREHPEKVVCDDGFPPPPPPVFWEEEAGGDPQQKAPRTSVPKFSRQPSAELSLEKLRSFAAPKPFIPAAPSPFARAVAMAVKRSNSLNQGSLSPTPSSPTDLTFVVEQKESSENVGSTPLWPSTEHAMEPREAEISRPGWNGEPANHPEMATGAEEASESPLQL